MPWHQFMMTSSNGDIFRVTGPLCGEFTGPRSFDVFFDLRLNKRLSKQSWGCWFDTPSSPLWRHRTVLIIRALVPVSKITCSLYVILFYPHPPPPPPPPPPHTHTHTHTHPHPTPPPTPPHTNTHTPPPPPPPPNLNVSRLGLQVSSYNILKPSVQWRMNM